MALVQGVSKSLKLKEKSIDLDLIEAHFLRAGGSTNLKIIGYNDSTMIKFYSWTSDTWNMYIHSRILYPMRAKTLRNISIELTLINMRIEKKIALPKIN